MLCLEEDRINNHIFNYNETFVIASDSTYLSITFNYNVKFNKGQKCLYGQPNRAIFLALNICRHLMLSVDLKLQSFDWILLTILVYGAKVGENAHNIIINKL